MRIRTSFILLLVLLGFLGIGGGSPAFGQELPKKVPVNIRADKLDYDRTTDVYVAEGNVRIEQQGITLEANKVVLDNKTGQATAEGRVYMQEKGEILRAERMEININTRAGTIYNGEIFMVRENYHIQGVKIEKESDTVFRVEQGTVTTCDEKEWYLRAAEFNVDMDRYATGKHLSFNAGGLPVFYTPYLLFPVRRQTGLLIPEAGYGSNEGFLMKNYFFWAISDYQDMTLVSDYRAKHGLGTGVEYRYVNSRDSAGKFWFNYFDVFNSWKESHPAVPSSLWEFKFQHQEEIAEDLSARADIDLVSNFSYFRELEKKLDLRSRPYTDSNVFYVERWDTSSLYLLGQYSTDLTQPNDKTIQKLPELRYTIFQENIIGPAYLSFDGSAANFSLREGSGGRRAELNPKLSLALSSSGLSLVPRVGMRGMFYDRSRSDLSEPSNLIFGYGGVDLNARLSRVYGADEGEGIGRIRHSIEPTISYNYVPRVDTSNIPQFDALDTVTQQNLLTVSLVNRLTASYREGAKMTTFDMMVFSLSQSYDMLVTGSPDPAAPHQRSEIQGQIAFNTPKIFTVAANGSYNTYIHRFTSSTESLSVRGSSIQVALSHLYSQPAGTTSKTEYLTGGLGIQVKGWEVRSDVWYDQGNRRVTQKEYRASHHSQCWGLGITYISRPEESQYLLTLELKGIGMLKF